jgi:TRAP-type uncharacterized transport system substrate-binding protein
MKLLKAALLAGALLSIGGFIPQSKAQTDDKTIRLCTGSSSGVYYQVGNMIQSFMSKDYALEVIETEGTFQNMDLMLQTGTEGCDAMIGQPDGPVYLKRTKPSDALNISRVMKLHREYLHVICAKESGIDDLEDVGSSNTVAIGAPGSGAWLMWQNFIEQDSGFADIKTTSDSGLTALTAVASNELSCMLAPSGVPNGVVSEADANFGDAVILASATDKDFNDATDIDGKPLYEFLKLPTQSYTQTFGRGFFRSEPKTLSWNAGLYVNKKKLSGKKLEALLKGATRARTTVLGQYGS